MKKLWVAGRAGEDRRVDGGGEGPLRKLLRRQLRNIRGAVGEASGPKTQRRQSGCLAGEESRNHCRQSRPSPGQDDEEGQRPAGLLGDRDAAGTFHGVRVRHHTLVRERIQR